MAGVTQLHKNTAQNSMVLTTAEGGKAGVDQRRWRGLGWARGTPRVGPAKVKADASRLEGEDAGGERAWGGG